MANETIYEICRRVDAEIESDFGGGCPIEKMFLMAYLVQNQKLKTYAEIGIYKGKSLFPTAYSIYLNGGKSYGIDPYSFGDAAEFDAPEDIQERLDSFLPAVDFEKLYQDVVMYREKCGYGESLKIIRKPSQDAIAYFKENNIKIDLLHIDGNHDTKYVRQDFELYNEILSEGGFIVFDDIDWESVNVVYKEAKKKLTLVFECKNYGILYKENKNFKDFVKTEKLSKRLTAVHDKIIKKKAKEGLPLVTIGVLAYNHEDYIAECLRSIVEQKGNFRRKIIILDDNSTDNTEAAVKGYLKNAVQSDLLQIEYIRNKENLGIVKNYGKLMKLIQKSGCDYFTFCEGDDFYLTNNRLEIHLVLHQRSPELALSFNKLLLYYQEENKYEIHFPDFNDTRLSTEDLVIDNKPGSFCASFYDIDVLDYMKDGLFDGSMCTFDWMFNTFCSQFGDIGHINFPMSVYRKHSGGAWSGGKEIQNNLLILENIPKYDKYLDFLYGKQFQAMYDNCARFLISNKALKPYDFVIIDDISANAKEGLSSEDSTALLKNFKNTAYYISDSCTSHFSERLAENTIVGYKREHPEFSGRVFYLNSNTCFNAKMLYGKYLNTAYEDLLAVSARLNTPFIFMLDKDGGFIRDDEESDKKLAAVFASPWFKKVVVKEKDIYNYLIDKELCKKEDIEYIAKSKSKAIFGVQQMRRLIKAANDGPAAKDVATVEPASEAVQEVVNVAPVETAQAVEHPSKMRMAIGKVAPRPLKRVYHKIGRIFRKIRQI